jgi:dolichyl-phosphate-mannose-protein mannosyltransferase
MVDMEVIPVNEVTNTTEIKRSRLQRIFSWEYFWLCIVVGLLLIMHFSLVYQEYHPFFLFQRVNEGNYFLGTSHTIFDEEHYVKDARAILAGESTQRPEHLPLGKLVIVAGMILFGDNPFGWRFFPILLGAVGIVFFYLVCRQLKMSKTAAYLATFFLALENQTFIQTYVAMLDVSLLPLMLISFWLYLKKNYLAAGLFVGLAGLVKLTGFMALPAMVMHWIITRRGRDFKFPGLIVVSLVSFISLLPGLEYFTFGHLVNPIDRIKTVVSMSSGMTWTTAYQTIDSRPWDWILKVDLLPFYYRPHYVGTIGLTVWYFIIPLVGYMIYRTVLRNEAAHFALWWFFGTFILWIPLSIITDRISFVFYFFPSIGAICIGLGLAFAQLADAWRFGVSKAWRWASIIGLAGYLILHVVLFLALSPFTSWWIYPI